MKRKGEFASMAIVKALSGFLLFIVLYYLPKMLEGGFLAVPEPRVRLLLEQAFAVSILRFDVLVNMLGHLLVLLPCYLVLRVLARRFSLTARLSYFVSVMLVFGVFWVFMLAVNSVIFPLSDYSYGFYNLARPEVAILSGVMLLLMIVTAFWSLTRGQLFRLGGVMAGLGATVGVIGFVELPVSAGEHGRNIVIVGIDSLSGSAYERLEQQLPNIDRLVENGTYYSRAYTPLGRTFPAWMSILTGQPPSRHGGYFNLRSLDHVSRDSLLSKELRQQGYRTIFAIDERRFNNMDERFGFDQIVGPRAGALDFVLQRLNDAPLTNLLLQSSVARWVLPFSHQNVASYVSYDGDGFVGSVLDSVERADRVFLAVHFESAHFPFKSRHVESQYQRSDDFWSPHVETLKVVDRQVGELMGGLEARGILNDALVIVLSDHGEGLGLLESVTSRSGEMNEIRTYGHGGDLLSDHQNRIVLAALQFKNGRPIRRAARYEGQVSLLDIKPMVTAYVGKGEVYLSPSAECLFVETGIRFSAMADYRTLNKEDLASQSAGYYEVDMQGYLQLKESTLAQLVDTKDVGLRCRDRITYFSDADDRFYTYGLSSTGIVGRELKPVMADIRQIEEYRRHYQARLQQ